MMENMIYSEYSLSKIENRKMMALLIAGVTVISLVFYQNLLPVAFTAVLYKPCKKAYCRLLAKKRRNALCLQFKDFLYSISASFATGRHMAEALSEARHELAKMYGDGDAIMVELDSMIHKIKETGATEVAVLEDFADRAGIEDISDFVQVFRSCRETGGDMVSSINKSAVIIGEKITIENDIRVMVAQKKFEGRIITLMPMAIIIFLRLMSPDYLAIMYDTLMGRILMTAALAATAFAYVIIERITDIEV